MGDREKRMKNREKKKKEGSIQGVSKKVCQGLKFLCFEPHGERKEAVGRLEFPMRFKRHLEIHLVYRSPNFCSISPCRLK